MFSERFTIPRECRESPWWNGPLTTNISCLAQWRWTSECGKHERQRKLEL